MTEFEKRLDGQPLEGDASVGDVINDVRRQFVAEEGGHLLGNEVHLANEGLRVEVEGQGFGLFGGLGWNWRIQGEWVGGRFVGGEEDLLGGRKICWVGGRFVGGENCWGGELKVCWGG